MAAKTVPCPHCSTPLVPMQLFGRIRSRKKTAAARENGKAGGRPINPNSARQKRLRKKTGAA